MPSFIGKNVRAAPMMIVKSTECKFFTPSAANNRAVGGYGGALALSRTDSQKIAALTGRSREIARAALNAVGDDPDSAFKLLMSDLALTVVDGLPCEIEPLVPGAFAWLDGTGKVEATGAFGGCSILRIQADRKEPLQLFALEPVDVCLLTKEAEPLEEGWVELEYTELPEVIDVEAGLIMQTRRFDPGSVVVPLGAALLPPIVRVIGKRAVAPPRNSVLPRSLAAPRSAPQRVSLPPVVEAGGEAGTAACLEECRNSGHLLGQQPCGGLSSHEGACSDKPEASKRYHTLNSVGRGSFGTVYLAQDSRDGSHVAVKCICQNAHHRIAMREAELLSTVKHPCVVSLLDSFEERGSDGKLALHLVMEYLPQNLHQKIAGKPLQLGNVRCFSFQLLRALAHLDGMQVCHRDLKPENVLLNHRTLKLADFGSAKLMGVGPSSNYICSRWWRAPELVLGTSEYSTSVDWWSCGCVVAEMMFGRPLFRGQSSLGQIYEIMQALGTPNPEDIQAMHPRRGLGRIAEQLMKLAKLERAARPWHTLLPAFAGVPAALHLAEKLLKYMPSARVHPAEALCASFFTSFPEDDGALGPLPPVLFSFTEVELCTLSATSRETLLDLASRHDDRKAAVSGPCTEGAEVPAQDESSFGAAETSGANDHGDDETSSSVDGDEVGEAAAELVSVSRRSTVAAALEGRRLKRRRISNKAVPTPIFIRLDSEDLVDVL